MLIRGSGYTKPPPGAELDCSHQFGRPVFYVPFNEGAGVPRRIDINRPPSTNTGASWRGSSNGSVLTATAANLRYTVSAREFVPLPMTIVLGMRTVTAANVVIAEANGNAGWSLQAGTGGNPDTVALGVNSSSPSFVLARGLTDGRYHNTAWSLPAGGSGSVYADGGEATQATFSPSNPNYGSATTIDLFGRQGAFTFIGDIGYLGIYPFAMSAQAGRLFTAEPYAMLRTPPWRRVYDMAAVAPAAGLARIIGGGFFGGAAQVGG